jgi:DNA adenine methylase
MAARSGSFSPLRYPGGKGKLAKFVADIIRLNGLSDGLYVEPYAGGAAVAWELLLTGVVRRVAINDISLPVYNFWYSVLNETEKLTRLIRDTPLLPAPRSCRCG